MKHAIRYLLALLWHWSVPFAIGCAVSMVLIISDRVDVLVGIDEYFTKAIQEVVDKCAQ